MSDFSVYGWVKELVSPLAKLVDDVHTSTEEKLEGKAKLKTLENTITAKVIEYETKLLNSKTAIITAEANGQSWIQRNWRPITMLTFLALVALDSFGLLVTPIADEMWTLLQIGLGGYVASRGIEKTATTIVGAIKAKA